MPNGGIPQKEFMKELDRVQLSRRHADIAFAWMRDKGRQGVYGIWYYGPTRFAPVKSSAWAALYDGNNYFFRQAAKFIYLFALNEKDGLNEEPPFYETDNTLHPWDMHNFDGVLKKLGILKERFPKYTDSKINTPPREDSMTKTAIKLLEQFYQIIFHGPPGTGKTHCAKQLLPELLGDGWDDRWSIVQFHPSYNYEDFVRGVQVETTQSGQVAYKTLNRTFGDMCANASKHPDEKFALIIDEINRANVSAVLGELIYALEYRGQPVNTPYAVGGEKELVIPKNLYVIGTMNTADRTIGQIDYAVRRRFAFVACPPDEQIVRDNSDNVALDFFNRVNAIFNEHTSPDFDAADVRVGHSYFLATGRELGYKLVYQVVPILREYVKDGVLQESATPEIDEIETDAKKLLAGESAESDLPAGHIAKFITPEFNEKCDWDSFGPDNQHPMSDYAHFYKWRNKRNPAEKSFGGKIRSKVINDPDVDIALCYKSFWLDRENVKRATIAMQEAYKQHLDFAELWLVLPPPHVPSYPAQSILVVRENGETEEFNPTGKVFEWIHSDSSYSQPGISYQIVLTAYPNKPRPAARPPDYFPVVFYWKHRDGKVSKTDKIGHCGRDVLSHFVKQNLDKTVEWFQEKLQPGRVALLANIPEKSLHGQFKRYFAKPDFQISLDNGDIVVVSNQFGAGNDSWNQFKASMAKHDYSITEK